MEKAIIMAPIKGHLQPKGFTINEGKILSSEKISEDYDPILHKFGFTHLLKIEAQYPVKLMQELLQKYANVWDFEEDTKVFPESYTNELLFIEPIYLAAFTWVSDRLLPDATKEFKKTNELPELLKGHIKMAKLHDMTNAHFAKIHGYNLIGMTLDVLQDDFNKFIQRLLDLNKVDKPN